MVGKRDLLFLALIVGGAAWTFGPLVSQQGERVGTMAGRSGSTTGDFRATLNQLDASLRGEGEGQSSIADDLVVLRRVHLGLTGAIPSLAAVRAFEAIPMGPDRLARWVDGLLGDPRTSDYLAERLARAFVGVEGGQVIVFRRRRFVAWLADEIRRNRPYDQVVRALVADRGLGTDHPATNFLAVTYDNATKDYDPEALAARVARAFLGVRLDCAQCHDHPFASWRRADFQGLAAFFGQVEARASGVVDGSGEFHANPRSPEPGAAIAPRVPFQAELVPTDGTRRERLAGWITDPQNQAFRRAVVNRIWAILVGRPLVEPIDDIAAQEADTGSLPPALDLLADDLAEHGFDLLRLIRLIAASDALRLDSTDPDGPSAEAAPNPAAPFAWGRRFPITRLRPEQVAGSLVQVGSTATIDGGSHVLVRLVASGQVNDFITAHGDLGADEFAPAGPATIPQRLLLMNGKLTEEKVRGGILTAAGRIARFAPDNDHAVEAAFLAVLTRRPTPDEARHFAARLGGDSPASRDERLGDLFWVLVNSTEFGTNH